MEYLTQTDCLMLWLSYGVKHDVRRARELRMRFPQMEEALELTQAGHVDAFDFLPEEYRTRLKEASDTRFMDRYARWLEKNGIGITYPEKADYPLLLQEIYDPPTLLFYKGRMLAEPYLPLAVIGARQCTRYGTEVAKYLSHALAERGATIVAGLARGIDGRAAEGALACGEAAYPTVAVLGSGIDVVYPPEHRDLYAQIAERGAVITEFLPKTRPLRENFPIRNRIMSGLSRGVIVVEAGERSGTSITAGLAHEQGREVFCVPGNIDSPMSIGTNGMIHRGEAKPVFCVEDILTEFGGAYNELANGSTVRTVMLDSLKPTEQRIVRLLQSGEKTVDELSEALACPMGELNSSLTSLQISGILKQFPGRMCALDTLGTVFTETTDGGKQNG